MKLLRVAPFVCALAVATANPLVHYNSSATPDLGYMELLALQNAFWRKFRYPNNIKEAQSINSTVFSEDVQGKQDFLQIFQPQRHTTSPSSGRVSDTRNFIGRELNTEYIFGLFSPSSSHHSTGIIGLPGPHTITQFLAIGNIAAASTTIQFTFPSFANLTLPVRIDTWLTYNAARQISQYDVTFRWFGFLLATLIRSLNPADPVRAQTEAVTSIAASICNTHATYCHGADAQYADEASCYEFLTKGVRVGLSWELGMDTLLCRSVHEVMVRYRPGVHCPHIGRGGGGMCDDKVSYVAKVSEPYFTNAPWIPEMRGQ